MASRLSSVYLGLDYTAKKRYKEKLELIGPGTVDPYTIRPIATMKECDRSLFPPVGFPDLYAT